MTGLRIACVGGGPGGSYLAALLSQPGSSHQVTVFERRAQGASEGWGVTLAPGFLDSLATRDGATAARLREVVAPWEVQRIQLGDRDPVRCPAAGHAIARSTLARVLAEHAEALGATFHYSRRVTDAAELAGYDLVVAADGARSTLRAAHADDLGTVVDVRPNRYTWLGTTKRFEEFTIGFVRTPAGWMWAGASSFEPGTSGFYVEMSPRTWAASGYDTASPDQTLRSLEHAFAAHLDGHRLLPQTGSRGQVPWLQFHRVTNERWHTGNLVLLGDAARTVHFSVGQGTILAMADAEVLAEVLGRVASSSQIEPALVEYAERRRAAVTPLQTDALTSLRWFEHVDRYTRVGGRHFAMLYNRRRSSLLGRVPVRAYTAAADAAAALAAARSTGVALRRRPAALEG